jgi:hypothetical protein
MKDIQLKHRKTGKTIKVGSVIHYGGERCTVYKIVSKDNIGLESKQTGSSWDMIRACDIDCFVVGEKVTLPENCNITRLEANLFALEYSEFGFEATVPKLNEIRIKLGDFLANNFIKSCESEPIVYVREGDVAIGYIFKGKRNLLEKQFNIKIADRH